MPELGRIEFTVDIKSSRAKQDLKDLDKEVNKLSSDLNSLHETDEARVKLKLDQKSFNDTEKKIKGLTQDKTVNIKSGGTSQTSQTAPTSTAIPLTVPLQTSQTSYNYEDIKRITEEFARREELRKSQLTEAERLAEAIREEEEGLEAINDLLSQNNNTQEQITKQTEETAKAQDKVTKSANQTKQSFIETLKSSGQFKSLITGAYAIGKAFQAAEAAVKKVWASIKDYIKYQKAANASAKAWGIDSSLVKQFRSLKVDAATASKLIAKNGEETVDTLKQIKRWTDAVGSIDYDSTVNSLGNIAAKANRSLEDTYKIAKRALNLYKVTPAQIEEAYSSSFEIIKKDGLGLLEIIAQLGLNKGLKESKHLTEEQNKSLKSMRDYLLSVKEKLPFTEGKGLPITVSTKDIENLDVDKALSEVLKAEGGVYLQVEPKITEEQLADFKSEMQKKFNALDLEFEVRHFAYDPEDTFLKSTERTTRKGEYDIFSLDEASGKIGSRLSTSNEDLSDTTDQLNDISSSWIEAKNNLALYIKQQEQLEEAVNRLSGEEKAQYEALATEKGERIKSEQDRVKDLEKQYEDLIKTEKKAAEELKRTQILDWADKIGETIKNIAGSITEAIRNSVDSQKYLIDKNLENIQKALDEEDEMRASAHEKQQEDLEMAYERGEVSEEEYLSKKQALRIEEETRQRDLEAKRAEAEERAAKKKNELDKKAFDAEKANSITQLIIDSLLASMKVWAGPGTLASKIVQQGLIAAEAGVSLGVIGSKQFIPSYDTGTDYVPFDQLAQIHKGEAVLTKAEAERYRSGNLPYQQANTSPIFNIQLTGGVEMDGERIASIVLQNIDEAYQRTV